MYKPPFTVSAVAINRIAEITRLIERYAIRLEQEDGLRLRKANRIRTIHSSLAIEGNALTVDEVSDIVEGKVVVAPIRQIQEVKNAIKTYEMYASLDPFSEQDLLRAHAQMMEALVDNPGVYRTGGVGVFSEKGLEHMAPPADRVPTLMHDLFLWLKSSNDHLLIRSCVFHYEFEFIHPFADGNGRMGRLWQSLILGRLHPLFEHLPVENMVFANQQAYYDAIAASSNVGDSGPFIDFMLGELLEALRNHRGKERSTECETSNVADELTDRQRIICALIRKGVALNVAVNTKYLADNLGINRKTVQREMATLIERRLVVWVGSDRTGHWEICND